MGPVVGLPHLSRNPEDKHTLPSCTSLPGNGARMRIPEVGALGQRASRHASALCGVVFAAVSCENQPLVRRSVHTVGAAGGSCMPRAPGSVPLASSQR